MRITIPDDVADPYLAFADAASVPLDEVITQQLKRFAHLHPREKAIVVPAKIHADLAAALGHLPLRDAADLLTRIKAHGQITFESLDIGLTPTQKAELAYRAERQGKTVDYLLAEMAGAFLQDFFYASGGGPAAITRKAG